MIRLTIAEARKLGIIPQAKQRPKKPRASAQWDAKILPDGVWLQIPEIPPSLNVWSKWHWAKQHGYKQDIYNAVSALVVAYRLPKVKFACVTITYYFKTHRRRDMVDNFCPKMINDALVNGGLLEDDRSDWVTVELVAEYDKERPRVEIKINPVKTT